MKIDLLENDWTAVANTLVKDGRLERSPRLLRLAALIHRQLGLSKSAKAFDAEADRLAV
jgi:hypothetical protein